MMDSDSDLRNCRLSKCRCLGGPRVQYETFSMLIDSELRMRLFAKLSQTLPKTNLPGKTRDADDLRANDWLESPIPLIPYHALPLWASKNRPGFFLAHKCSCSQTSSLHGPRSVLAKANTPLVNFKIVPAKMQRMTRTQKIGNLCLKHLETTTCFHVAALSCSETYHRSHGRSQFMQYGSPHRSAVHSVQLILY
jgi:hypothetical protein